MEIIMKTTENLRLARFLKTVLDICFGALVIACIGLVLWIALSPVVLSAFDIRGTASIPVLIGSGEEPTLEVVVNNSAKSKIQASYIADAKGLLRLETRNLLFLFTANAAKLLVGVFLAYIFNLLRSILQNIIDGDPFSPNNVQRLRRLGYAILIICFLRPSVEYIAANEILNQLKTKPILNPGSTFRVETLLTSLLIILLAYIWNYALELERDRALTV
jgi:hypothetical protein